LSFSRLSGCSTKNPAHEPDVFALRVLSNFLLHLSHADEIVGGAVHCLGVALWFRVCGAPALPIDQIIFVVVQAVIDPQSLRESELWIVTPPVERLNGDAKAVGGFFLRQFVTHGAISFSGFFPSLSGKYCTAKNKKKLRHRDASAALFAKKMGIFRIFSHHRRQNFQ
jgi:hypothetical protein